MSVQLFIVFLFCFFSENKHGEVASLLAKMGNRVSESGFYVPTPTLTPATSSRTFTFDSPHCHNPSTPRQPMQSTPIPQVQGTPQAQYFTFTSPPFTPTSSCSLEGAQSFTYPSPGGATINPESAHTRHSSTSGYSSAYTTFDTTLDAEDHLNSAFALNQSAGFDTSQYQGPATPTVPNHCTSTASSHGYSYPEQYHASSPTGYSMAPSSSQKMPHEYSYLPMPWQNYYQPSYHSASHPACFQAPPIGHHYNNAYYGNDAFSSASVTSQSPNLAVGLLEEERDSGYGTATTTTPSPDPSLPDSVGLDWVLNSLTPGMVERMLMGNDYAAPVIVKPEPTTPTTVTSTTAPTSSKRNRVQRASESSSSDQEAERKISCTECDRCFTTKANLQIHLRTHSGERPFQCSRCPKTFAQRSTLRTHLRTHTGEKPYACQDCQQRFADYSTLIKHRRVHSGLKPYVCDVCARGFSQSGNMSRHRKTHFQRDASSSSSDQQAPASKKAKTSAN